MPSGAQPGCLFPLTGGGRKWVPSPWWYLRATKRRIASTAVGAGIRSPLLSWVGWHERFCLPQAAYAQHHIATYPLTARKTPAVRGYDRIGAPYSAKLATRFPDAMAGGFVAGPHSRVTVIDIDSPDDRLVEEIQKRFGVTPLQVRTPSGGRHLYYRHAGEARRIKPLPDVDVLGGGNVVAALSVVPKGRYDLERGTLDALAKLPQMQEAQQIRVINKGVRNNTLFRHCQAIVDYCDTLDQLLDAARTWADGRLAEPLPEAEVIKTANSVWNFRGGRRRVMQNIVEKPCWGALIANPKTLALFSYLSAENGPNSTFMVADDLGPARNWPRRLVPDARKALLDLGVIRCVRRRGKNAAALYRWSIGA